MGGKVGNDSSIDLVRLGPLSHGLSVVANASGVDDDDRHPGGLQFHRQSQFISAGGLQDNPLGLGLGQEQPALLDTLGIVVVPSGCAFGQEMQVKVMLGDVDSYNLHRRPLPCICELTGYNGSGDCSGSCP